MESSAKRGAGWRVAAALVGLTLMLVSYYWVHKPLDPVLIASLGGAALDVLTAGVVAAVAGGLGRRAIRLIWRGQAADDGLSRAERTALDGLLGMGVMAWLALLLGLIGLYNRGALWLGLLIIALLCIRDVLGWLRDMRMLARRAVGAESGWTRFLSVIIIILLLTALLHAVMPPTAFDALNYHLVGPTRYLEAGRIAGQADNHFLGFPQGVEILYGVSISLFGRDTAAAPLHWIFGLLGLLAVGGLVRRYINPSTAWLAVVLLIGAFSVWLLFGWPYVDLAMMAYGAAALVAAVRWRDIKPHPHSHSGDIRPHSAYPSPQSRGGETRWLILMGVYAGLALGVKYTAVGLLLGLAVFVAANAPRQMIRNGVVLGVAALLAFLPWAVKGTLLYQNPVYPFALGGLNWDAGRSNTFSTTGTGLLGSNNAWQLAVLPVSATVFGVEKGDNFSFTASPWLLTAPLLLALVWGWLDERARGLAKDCLLLGLPMLAFWMVMAALSSIGVQTRLMMMAMPTFAAAGAIGFYGLSRLPRKPVDVYFVARALIALTLIFTLLDVIRDTVRTNTLPYLMGYTDKASYVARNAIPGQASYVAAMQELGRLPEGSQVRMMWETRTYYCPDNVTCTGDILFDHWARALRGGQTADEAFEGWKAAGDDYLLVFNLGYDFHVQDSRFPENADFPETLEQWMSPIWSDEAGVYTLYGWRD